MFRQENRGAIKEETDRFGQSQLVPSSSDTSLNSLRQLSLDSKEDSSLSYHSMEMKYLMKDKQTYRRNDDNFNHYHSLEVCYKRQRDEEFVSAERQLRGQAVGSSLNRYEASGGATGTTSINSMQENRNSATGGPLRSYSSGYSSGVNREKVWVEMYDGYENEMRKRVYSDTPLLKIKLELMEVAEKWKFTEGRDNYKILNMEKKYDLCELPPVFLEEPVGRSQYFMVQYF